VRERTERTTTGLRRDGPASSKKGRNQNVGSHMSGHTDAAIGTQDWDQSVAALKQPQGPSFLIPLVSLIAMCLLAWYSITVSPAIGNPTVA
jgi:hypothetical protein